MYLKNKSLKKKKNSSPTRIPGIQLNEKSTVTVQKLTSRALNVLQPVFCQHLGYYVDIKNPMKTKNYMKTKNARALDADKKVIMIVGATWENIKQIVIF